jgi:hypothetical protein
VCGHERVLFPPAQFWPGLPPSPAGVCRAVPAVQVKDVMAHLYFKAKESFAQQAPKEVRWGACCVPGSGA